LRIDRPDQNRLSGSGNFGKFEWIAAGVKQAVHKHCGTRGDLDGLSHTAGSSESGKAWKQHALRIDDIGSWPILRALEKESEARESAGGAGEQDRRDGAPHTAGL
jgi:hypothetical protein